MRNSRIMTLPHSRCHFPRLERCFHARATSVVDFDERSDEALQLVGKRRRNSIEAAGFDFHRESQLIRGLEGRVKRTHLVQQAAQ